MRLEDKIAIVTGAGSGIGKAIADSFAQEGAQVFSVGRTLGKLEQAKSEAGAAAGRIHPRALDVSDQAAVVRLVRAAVEEFGKIDILVNNAGTNVPQRALEVLSPEDFDKMVRINLSGPFYLVHEVLPVMRSRRDGLIINVSSVAGVRASTLGGAGYTASKFGLSGLSKTIGMEEGKNGIRSCLICPGEVNTPILDNRLVVPDAAQRAVMLQPEDLAAAALLVATLHPRATIPEMIISPTIQEFN
ncbi:MAG: SDR family oxidoreductase [Acidobacteria bacterium]|nr:SDR family oxidoreductase [Acidobacteriota bacterium]